MATSLTPQVKDALSRATQHAWNEAKPDGHWNAEFKANVTVTAEYVFLYQSLSSQRKGGIPDADKLRRHLLHEQQRDGSWTIAPDLPGDVSATVETYLALKILGLSPDAPEMRRARAFVLASGGAAQVRVYTRFLLAQFGLVPWDATPELPAELILLPAALPLNIYRLSTWTRTTIVPMLLIAHHRPVYALPNGASRHNTFIDELWLEPRDHAMPPLGVSLLRPLEVHPVSYVFTAVDRALRWLDGLRGVPWVRTHARRKCVEWILNRQENAGHWGGIIPPMLLGVQALLLEGHTLRSDPVLRGLHAIEQFAWHDAGPAGKRLQSSVSPVWDTILMIQALLEARVPPNTLSKSIRWLRLRQQTGPEGDWRVYSPHLAPGAFSFEYHNAWYPDVDDTCAAIVALVRYAPEREAVGATVSAAAAWLCGMQNRDGGWAAFDKDNDQLWLNKVPFGDLGNMCDPSVPDCTGHVLEAFGLVMRVRRRIGAAVDEGMVEACERGIRFLERTQEQTGAWYGRWAINYVFGTSCALGGLAYFADRGDSRVARMMQAGVAWLKQVHNDDGGWGESPLSYSDPARHAGRGPSTPSQTAWALLGLLTVCGPDDADVRAGVAHLLRTQTEVSEDGKAASWPERLYTGTGFPNHFYLGYPLYRHSFPMMALGRFVAASETSSTHGGAKQSVRPG